ncbi:MAG: ABC transporter ATP-binding protein [Pseudomonadaceae bacterium]|nr:ABC transporter ATP-binding protein [Pseudomonadaceae bacterium]
MLLQVENLAVEFLTEYGWVTVVDGINFEIAPGETLGLVGESGSGKTVSALSIMRLVPTPPGRISQGRILLQGEDMLTLPDVDLRKRRGRDVAMVFQESMTSLNPAFTIGEQIAESVRAHMGLGRRAAMDRAVEVLDLVRIPDPRQRATAYPHEFSGGMRQRAAIAMALACEPKLLIADEPTTALDVTVQAQILDLLRQLQERFDMGMLFVTHNLGVVADICDRVAVMYAGQIVETANVEDLFAAPTHPYTEGLLRAMPQLGEPGERLPVIAGSPPVPWALPNGCRFAPRCSYAQPICSTKPPQLEDVSGHFTRCPLHSTLSLRGAGDA